VFTAQYALSPYIKQTGFAFKGLNYPHYLMKVMLSLSTPWRHTGSRSTVPLILNLGTLWMRVVSVTHMLLYAQGKSHGPHWLRGWVGPTVWTFFTREKSLPLQVGKSQIIQSTPAIHNITLINDIKRELDVLNVKTIHLTIKQYLYMCMMVMDCSQ
jgi:hypothetical protein